MFTITASLNGKIEDFLMATQEQVDQATILLEHENWTILMVSERV